MSRSTSYGTGFANELDVERQRVPRSHRQSHIYPDEVKKMLGVRDRSVLAMLPVELDFWDWIAVMLPARRKKVFVRELIDGWVEMATTAGLVLAAPKKDPWSGYSGGRGGGGSEWYRSGLRGAGRWGAMLG